MRIFIAFILGALTYHFASRDFDDLIRDHTKEPYCYVHTEKPPKVLCYLALEIEDPRKRHGDGL